MTFKLFMTSLTLLYFYSLIYLMPELEKVFVSALILSAIFIGIQLFFQYINKRNPIRCFNYMTLLWLLTGFMFLMTLVYSLFNVGDYTISTVIQDIMSMIMLNSGAVLTVKMNYNDENIIKYLKFIGVIAIVSGLISFSYADFSLGRDANVWQPQYIWWGLLFPWSYLLLYRVIMKKNNVFWNVMAFGSTVMYIVLGLLFGKRVVLFDLAIILFIIVIATKKRSFMTKIIKTGMITLCILLLGVFASQYIFDFKLIDLFNSTWIRITSDSIQEFDRLNEFKNVLVEYPYSIIITGAGLGSYHSGPGGINLHIGWLNFIFKGGILYFALELWVFSIAIKTLFRTKDKWQKYLAACVVFSFMAILISSSWVASPITMNFSVMKFALLRVTDSNMPKRIVNDLNKYQELR